MKVVFVASGNKAVGNVSPFVQTQFESLQTEGLNMRLFPVSGKGFKGYLRAFVDLRRLIKNEHPDIVHAHYSVCGYVAYLASLMTHTRVVVSILGSFPRKSIKLHIVRFCIRHCWDRTIVKSQRTAKQLGMELPVIPNGVDLEKFSVMDVSEARALCGFESDKKYIIWCSNPSRPEKNYSLAQQAVALLNDSKVVLYPVYDKVHEEVVKYMCAADVLLLTSKNEGSPNVIKEALACNCPIVSTDVGDVAKNLKGVDGTYVATDESPEQISCLLRKALSYNHRTQGRARLIEKKLTTPLVAKKIINLYHSCL